MGLDMYLNGKRYYMDRPAEVLGKLRKKAEIYELGYWRKHPNLHGYIVDNFADGVDDCREIALGEDRINQLIEAVKAKELPETQGFFFGQSDGSDEEIAEDLTILQGALEWLLEWLLETDEGMCRSVSYRASW
jgi:hypothetical protein